MAPRRHIIDSLCRCLCPQFNNLLASKSAVAQFRPRNLSTPASLRCLSTTRPTHQSIDPVPGPASQTPPPEPQGALPSAEDGTSKTFSISRTRMVNSHLTWNKPVSFDRKERPFIRRARSALRGIEKVKDLAHRGAFPEVFDEARALVESGYEPDRELYAALVYACSNFPGCLMQDLALSLVKEMKGRGIQSNTEMYHHLLKLLATSPDYLKRAEVLKEMKDNWQTVSDDGWQWVIAGHLMGGNLELALGIIEERRGKGLVVHRSTYEHAIYRLCAAGEAEGALRIAKMLDDEGFWETPAKVVYDLLVVGAKQMHLDCTMWSWFQMNDRQLFIPDDGLCILTLNVAARYGVAKLATDVFRVLVDRKFEYGEHHFAALLETYLVADNLPTAFSVLNIMESANVPPKPNTTRSIVNKLTQNNSPRDIEAAYEILLAQRKLKNSVHIAALNTIIAAFVRISDVKSAFNVYKVIPNFDLRPDLQTFNWLLRGAAEQGRKKFAMWVVAEMQEMGIKPGEETYESLVLVCAAQEVINDAFAYLEEMKNMRFKPSARLYEALAVRCWELKDWRFEGVVKEMEEKGYSARGIVEMSHQRKAGEQAAVRAQGVQRVRAQEDEEGEGLQRDPADKVGEQLGRKLRW
ncbi:unnamed protein product [Tuber melanosporum]|uniref:(Perigord truffle) hypothetical protein n=1 Tax=Tuber melanosporum (strain Mel28) TaxID=656061 RepID=D5GCG4_TUBMM|nr:uncharacterized protein GSTUM_00005880001 [Tuber melanosporum]CAZ82207.1 unnamed protein product [Tuber melanosporum]